MRWDKFGGHHKPHRQDGWCCEIWFRIEDGPCKKRYLSPCWLCSDKLVLCSVKERICLPCTSRAGIKSKFQFIFSSILFDTQITRLVVNMRLFQNFFTLIYFQQCCCRDRRRIGMKQPFEKWGLICLPPLATCHNLTAVLSLPTQLMPPPSHCESPSTRTNIQPSIFARCFNPRTCVQCKSRLVGFCHPWFIYNFNWVSWQILSLAC